MPTVGCVPDQLDPDIRTPLHRQLADLLRAQIQSGEIPPDHALPSKRTLQQRYGLANATIDKALRILKAEGLIEAEKGKGMYVVPQERPRPAG